MNEHDPKADEAYLQFFDYEHLPLNLKWASAEFCAIATFVFNRLPLNNERTECLKHLLRAKDCAVRAVLWQDNNE